MELVKKSLVFGLLLAAMRSPATDRSTSSHSSDGEGKRIYMRNCAKCHELYPPNDYSQADWDKWMVKMRRKSKLKTADFDQVLRYTQTLRSGEPQTPAKKKK